MSDKTNDLVAEQIWEDIEQELPEMTETEAQAEFEKRWEEREAL